MQHNEHNKTLLLDLLHGGLDAVSATQTLPSHLPTIPPKGRTLILGAGKAAAAMARVAATHLDGPVSGLVVTRSGHVCDMSDDAITIMTAGHPVPDIRSEQAAQQMLVMVQDCAADDRLIFLASGGGSSLLCLPVAGLELAQKQAITRHLVYSGSPIAQINCVRKHLSRIKGGRLAAVSGTKDIRTFIISDVVGDEPSAIASGPTIADPTSLDDARAIIARYGCPFKKQVMDLLGNEANETPRPGTLSGQHTIIARAADALERAATLAQKQGWQVQSLGDNIEGEAREVGRNHAHLARKLKARGGRWLLLSGGETTVTVANKDGCGGPNLEYLAGLALTLNGEAGITALACDTDGIDGSEDNAGAMITPDTLRRAAKLDINLQDCLRTNQTYNFFKTLDDLVITGPTLTNVNDFRIIAIESLSHKV